MECFTFVVDLISDSPFSTFGGHSTGILKKQVFIFNLLLYVSTFERSFLCQKSLRLMFGGFHLMLQNIKWKQPWLPLSNLFVALMFEVKVFFPFNFIIQVKISLSPFICITLTIRKVPMSSDVG